MQSVRMNVDTGEKTWLTPPHILKALGEFDLDPCCPDGGMPWRTAKRMITKSENSLSKNWEGLRVWLNPPYGREAIPFFEKMVERNSGGGIALVFVRPDTRLWQDIIFPCATAILFLRGRLRFCKQDGTQGETATAPSALIAFSQADAAVLAEAIRSNKLQGFFMPNIKGAYHERNRNENASAESCRA